MASAGAALASAWLHLGCCLGSALASAGAATAFAGAAGASAAAAGASSVASSSRGGRADGSTTFGLWVEARTMNIDLPSSTGCRSTTPCSSTCFENRSSSTRPSSGWLSSRPRKRTVTLISIAVLEELDRPMELRQEVARADLRREPHFLEGHRALPALVLFLPLRQLVLVLPEVEKTSDRWSRHRCHLDEVEAFLLRHFEGSWRGHDAQLVPLVVDHSDLWDPDHLVDAQVSADGCFPLERRDLRAPVDHGKAAPVPVAAG